MPLLPDVPTAEGNTHFQPVDMQSPAAGLSSTKSSWFLVIGAALASLCLMIALFPASDGDSTHWIIDEGGLVETMTAVFYALAIVTFVTKGGLGLPMLRGHAIVLILAFLLARELDLHKQFTTMGIFRIEFYRSAEVAAGEKAVVIGFLVLLGLAVARMLWDLDRFVWGLRDRSPAMIADGSASKLGNLGYEIGPDLDHTLTKVEEILELGIPVFALIAILSYFAAGQKLESSVLDP